MAKGPELPRTAVPMQIAADDGIDLTAAVADSYRAPMAGAFNSLWGGFDVPIILAASSFRNFKSKCRTRIIKLLVSL
jgi:hypothetical protein